MKVIVFGATGGTGHAAVQELLDGGHEVTAFSRHADQLGLRSERLRLAPGDARDAGAVERAISGQDAVVVSLGVNDNPLKVRFLHRSNTPTTICSEGTRNIIQAMGKLGVRRLVVVSAFGVGETREKLPWFFKLGYRLIKEQISDKERQEQLVRNSGLDWVIVQPVGLTNGRPLHEVLASTQGEVHHHTIPRSSVGRFLASVVSDDQFLGRTVALSS
ncbi:NAD(P)-dependent oxidoreductase [Vitiosangium sp. GDMCC 1.1324]|uniref:NAD(P)-dependent oxidoreductase n=1 Tax=Vitiosangium sp. (strain GDMCC 1.1324) TaxID=2138576 RepID=UPI000D3497E1|nr:NAD(P)-binding oxidoreductase [Vitiosangium sp. GDMCC 1.1324]PTL75274.1 epimerase [Vitiosangium sp. GDMCC 1.1324]